jgi:hypothetical protein
MRNFDVTLTLAVLVAGCALAGCDSSARHKGPGRVYNAKNGFSLVPPQGWIDKGEFTGAFMFFTGPVQDGFAANLSVNVQRGSASAKETMPQLKSALKSVFAKYQPMDDGFTTIDGKEALFVSGKFQMGTFQLQNLQYQIFARNRVYTITFTDLAANFAKNRPLFEQVATSIRVD